MDNLPNNEFNLYTDIQARTKGEIYLGVVGPVRTGKSTFIKRFMDVLVLPYMEEEYERERAKDELPQSSGGKTITTTEPKFIPKEAAKLTLADNVNVNVRLIDCVGYMVEGASGHLEDNEERMVKTPWFDYEIPFTQAAELGTKKVISDHSTIGIVITTDGSFGEIPRQQYVPAEEKTIKELKSLHKPFVVLLNTEKPYSDEAKAIAEEIEQKYDVCAMPVNCAQLKKEDIHEIMEHVLKEFPISVMEFYMPKWVEMMPSTHVMKQEIIEQIKKLMSSISTIKDVIKNPIQLASDYIKRVKTDQVNMSDGTVKVHMDVDDSFYYDMISDFIGEPVNSEYQLLTILKNMSQMRSEYKKVQNAMDSVRTKGYGVVMPEREEIVLEMPEVIRHGNKFGIKMKAQSPSIHMIRANITTEIAPIVGTEEQAKDLITYIDSSRKQEEGIWDTNIFGKTVEQLVNDGIQSKVNMIGDESQVKLQETMQKIVNDSNGKMVCIII